MTKSRKENRTEKKMPIRTCIACRTKAEKKKLVRLVRTADGEVVVDSTGKIRGRGANLCPSIKCFDVAVQAGQLERALDLGRKLTRVELAQLRKDIERVIYEREFRRGKKSVTLRVQKMDLNKFEEVE